MLNIENLLSSTVTKKNTIFNTYFIFIFCRVFGTYEDSRYTYFSKQTYLFLNNRNRQNKVL